MADERLDKIEKELTILRNEFKEIHAALKHIAAEKEISLAKADLCDEMRDHLQQAAENIESKVRHNPFSTLATVAAVGFIFGFMSRR